MRTSRGRGIDLLIALTLAVASASAWAHCDALDGPVVADARVALAKGDATPVLKWVRAEDEREIRAAFEQAVAVRGKGDAARDLADRFFFETLVRVHRAGEGEPFTGLKPAGGVSRGIGAADEALAAGEATKLAQRMSRDAEQAIRRRFDLALERRAHAGESVAAGREFVEAYVDYIHFVEKLDELLSHGAGHAHHEAPAEH